MFLYLGHDEKQYGADFQRRSLGGLGTADRSGAPAWQDAASFLAILPLAAAADWIKIEQSLDFILQNCVKGNYTKDIPWISGIVIAKFIISGVLSGSQLRSFKGLMD
ncbi:hypothetical protein [Acetobacter orientalis]|uniref:hypothetical protein n=1 Tax=Acetobacter orientalis TaxID=146474 RepID=UPI0039ED1A63